MKEGNMDGSGEFLTLKDLQTIRKQEGVVAFLFYGLFQIVIHCIAFFTALFTGQLWEIFRKEEK